MRRIHFCLFFLLQNSSQLHSQILPRDNAKLNYRIIGFSFPSENSHRSCKLEIASGHFNSEDSFKKNIFSTVFSNDKKVIAEVPFFNKEYTWRYTYVGKTPVKSTLHHFSTGILPCSDSSNLTHLRILKKAEKHKDGFVFCDADRTLYDMAGKPVWYLPNVPDNRSIRDLKITLAGTITFEIDDYGAFETDYNGTVIWKAPHNGTISGDSTENIHHEFTRLSNGHYIVLAQEFRYWQQPTLTNNNLAIVTKHEVSPSELNTVYQRTPMGTLIEYDQSGAIVWSWKSADYLNPSNFFNVRTKDGYTVMHAHENSFYFDEKKRFVYLSCRNQNRIIKIKYPEGNIERIYDGSNNDAAQKKSNAGLFCGQHSCRISQAGILYLFNNNMCNLGEPPSVIMLEEPKHENENLKRLWEYKCSTQNRGNSLFASGGNVIELPDQSLFVSLGLPESKILIVNREKKLLWDAIFEKWNPFQKAWEPTTLYRASIIPNRKAFEKMVWGQQHQ